ncbi:MAG: 50S ribosomal protein L15 [Candidatus Peribacteraceae bacterium]|jgi:large subunit ribosomal protein L15|nr:50S ribosomal protein L15 [Candidatus Peribacteraceae bacterium]
MLHMLRPTPGSTQKRKRIARGNSAGGGTTAGRGTKGQQSRAGKGRKFGFEGGQVPLIIRQPKLPGFKRPMHRTFEVINLEVLEARLSAGAYDPAALRTHRLRSTNHPVKILGTGTVSKKFDLTVHAVSKSAREALTKAGGSVTIVQ